MECFAGFVVHRWQMMQNSVQSAVILPGVMQIKEAAL